MSKFFLTTPIYYVNDKPSIGHAYTTIVADTLARYHRLIGDRTFLLTGTDENSQKNTDAAAKLGRENDIQGYLDEMAALWQRTWDTVGLSFDRFIRTTEADHVKAVEKFWKAVEAKGDIYKGTYEGLYCKGCEAFVLESDLIDGLCQYHKKAPEKIKEDNYFFRLTAYRETLLQYIEAHPEFIQPESRRNEVTSYIKNFMTDVSISRSTMKWGIAVPGDESQRIYVWFDALINYLTGVGYGTDEKMFAELWPADVHLVGKDIIKFHCALWPAMLLSAGLPLPKAVFAHGFFTVNGEKMSKSLGNVVDPVALAAQYSNDVLRYYLLREIRLGEDGDFSFDRLFDRYNAELANEFGNLVNRVLAMTAKYFDGVVPERADGFLGEAWPSYKNALSEFRTHDAVETLWSVVRQANQFVETQAPWQLAKQEDKKPLADTMYILLETLRHIAWMLWPIMPDTAEKIFGKLGLDVPKELAKPSTEAWAWGGLEPGTKTTIGEPLFPRKDEKPVI